MKIYKELKDFAKNLTLLIVEDDFSLNEEISSLCGMFFKDVKSAYNGLEGLDIYKKNKIDIVLTDITMPYMNGVELCQKIKTIYDEQSIIVLSAHNEIDYFVDLIDVGIRQFVHKPFKDEDFLYRLLKVCEQVVLVKFYKEEDGAKEVEAHPSFSIKENANIKQDFNLFTHNRVSSQKFMQELKSDASSWNLLSEDINTLIEVSEDFEAYINQIYLGNLNGDLLYKMAFLLKKMHSILVQIKDLGGMADIFYDLSEFIKHVPFDSLSPEKQNKFTILEFIYDDISRFVQTVFVYKDTIDVHYLKDSLASSVLQLKNSVLGQEMEEEELELF